MGWKICNFDWLNLTLEIPVIKNPKSRVKFYRFDTVSIRFTMIPINLSPRLWTNLSSLFIIATHEWWNFNERTNDFFSGIINFATDANKTALRKNYNSIFVRIDISRCRNLYRCCTKILPSEIFPWKNIILIKSK